MSRGKAYAFTFLVSVMLSCGRGNDGRFARIDALCDSDPRLAMSMLDSIDYGSLSEKDRHLHDLLSIKSRDKAYVMHTSDSLILDVIDYYSSRKNDSHYPEALYYGGRVYSDIGDLPAALKYFQNAIDAIPDKKENARFRSILLNQTGRLLHSLRLDSAAVEYLEKSILLMAADGERSSDLLFSHGLIAASYMGMNDSKNARSHMDEALQDSSSLGKSEFHTLKTELAQLYLYEGKIDSALLIIRPLPSISDSLIKPYCLSVAAEIYESAGILDSAYLYARQLTFQKSTNNKKTGYKVIFSGRMADFVSKDTLQKLIPEYKQTIEDYLNTHEAEQAIIQNSHYNYNLQIRAREKTEQKFKNIKIIVWILVTFFAISILTISGIVLLYRYRKAKRETNNLKALNIAERLKEEINSSKNDFGHSSHDIKIEFPEIKHRVLRQIKAIRNQKPETMVAKTIIDSDVYKTLREKIDKRSCIVETEDIWNSINGIIESASPGFNERLELLTDGRITATERKVAHLMKFGFSPMEISVLMSRGRNTISSQRRSLANKISKEKDILSSLNAVIVLL